MRWLVLLTPLLAVMARGHDNVDDSAHTLQPVLEQAEASTVREQQIAHFLARRQALSPLCFYTFDRPVSRSPPTASDAAAAPPSAFFANHAPACPFGDLEFDPTIVTPLHNAEHAWQLGARVADDAHEQKRVQIASTGFVFARDFYAATVGAREPNESSDEHSGGGVGVTFEMALRRLPPTAPRAQSSNDSTGMTLFSIVNVYDGCVDPGFRVDVDRDRMLVLVYYLPVEGEIGEPACYEQLLRSAREHALFERQRTKCQLPEPTADEGANPPVSITVTIDPSSSKGVWRSEFRVSYADPVTLERVHCSAFGQKSPPLGTRLISQRVTGNFRLFLGNSPRNASAVRERRVPAPARTFRPLSSEDAYKNATERLRAALLDKLLSIEGPRIPEAMRIFGDKSISLELFGVEFPPVNEDTPLAYLRGKLRDFLVENGGNIVDHLIDLLRKVQPVDPEPNVSVGERIVQRTIALQRQEAEEGAAALREYPDAAFASSFDVFHFAIYARALTPKELDDSSWPTLGPFRPIPTTAQEVHMNEDDVMAVDLGLLHSVYDDVELELRALPELGQLLLYPSKAVVTRDNMTSFRDLPPAHQQLIYFQPNRDENNRNLPLPYSFAFARRSEPYAVIKVGMVGSSTGRAIDMAANASVKIFVDPVNDPPRPLHMEQRVVLPSAGVPVVLDLKGKDADGSPDPPAASSRSDNSSSGGETTSVLKTFVDRITSTHAPAPSPRQFVRVRRLPRFGRLYDMHLATQNVPLELPIGLDRTHLEKYRVSLDAAVNGSYSPNLVYVYGGWNDSIDSDSDTGVTTRSGDVELVDELQYQLSDSEDGVLSDLAVVKFVLHTSEKRRQRDSNIFKIVRLQEDASVAVTLADIEPLMGFLSARTRFVITDFPKHGALHQFHDLSTAAEDVHAGTSATYRVGRKLHNASRIVDDVDGRVVYVPERDYYNVVPDDNTTRSLIATGIDLDLFAFEPENLTHHVELFERWAATDAPPDSLSARAHALPFDAHRARVVQVQVVSEPDELILLPPMYFVANATQGSTVPTPVLFQDPDALYDGKYLATLKVKSGLSKFVLAGINISSDDVMRDCSLTRPCLLPRTFGANASTSQSTSARNESVEELTFVIQHLIYTPFHVTVLGTKRAVQRALSETTFTDWSVNFLEAHRKHFTVTIRRLNGTSATANTRSATATYTIDFPPRPVGGLGGMVVQAAHLVVGQLYAFVWTLLVCVVVCVLVSNASCGSGGGGSCCCCCAGRSRESRRRAVEDELVRFESQVAQNDYEYSMLLMDIADMALEPDLMFATSLVRAIHTVADRQGNADLRLLCVQSLVPVLELERQTTRLVFRLMVLEFQDALVANERATPSDLASEFLGASSCASHLLAYFCRYIGSNWLNELLIGVATADDLSVPESVDRRYHDQDNDDMVLGNCIERMARALPRLPAEVVILCRACATLLIDKGDRWRSDVSIDTLRAVHLVFFNHFVCPALLSRGEGVVGARLSSRLSSPLVTVACQLAALTRRWDSHPDDRRTDADRTISLVDDVELRRERRDQAHLHQYESLLHAVATSPTLQSSYNASAVDDVQPSSPDKMQDGEERDVDCDLMALCLTNIHSLLDSYLPQVEEHHRHLDAHRQQQQQLPFESEHTSASSRLSRLRTLLRALGFPTASVSAILECRAQEPREDELCGGFGHRERAAFADERTRQDRQCRLAIQTSPIDVERTAGKRPFGRSQSLLTVDIEDSLAFEYAFSDISGDSERF